MDDTEKRLIEAAGQVFAEVGFTEATVRAIVKRAGVKNVAAVNYYFGDKEGLYRATLENAFRCRFDQQALPVWPEGTPPARKLRDLIRHVIEQMVVLQQPWQVQLLMREMLGPSGFACGMVRDFIGPLYQLLWSVLRELLPRPVSEQKLHLISFSVIGQCFYHKIARPVLQLVVGPEEVEGYDVELLTEHIASFTLAALGVKPARNK
jgi:AcrR family transcriptional regulator